MHEMDEFVENRQHMASYIPLHLPPPAQPPILNILNLFTCLMITSHRLDIARSTLQISLKGLGNVKHFDDVLHTERFLLVDRKSLSCSYCILNLLQHVSDMPNS